MTWSFNNAIPAANNAPANDQPLMLQNNQSTASLVAVDHVGFNTAGGGQHLQITYNGLHPPGVAPTGLNSIGYTNIGIAKPASAQLFWQNQDSIFHQSAIRAWGKITEAGTIDSSQSFNIASVTRPVLGLYTITLTAGATESAAYSVITTSAINAGNFASIESYAITSATIFNVFISTPENTAIGRNAPFSFLVLQI